VQPFSNNTGLSDHTSTMNDYSLVEECVRGNQRAQKTLFERFAPKMLAVCQRYAKDIDEAEDILQDGFVKVFLKLGAFKQQGSLEGWIRRIMVNTALDQIRKNGRLLGDTDVDSVEFKLDSNDYIVEGLMAEDLMKLVMSMPDGYKTVFNLFAIEGYSHAEIAEMLGVNESTSKSQYSRARAYLRERIEKIHGKQR
jgi:RNA polymerase sigma factor (sigma-70 family)